MKIFQANYNKLKPQKPKTSKKPQPQNKSGSNSVIRTWLKLFGQKLLLLSSGIVKEFNRITWLKDKKLWSAYGIVISIIIIFALLFYVITIIAGLI